MYIGICVYMYMYLTIYKYRNTILYMHFICNLKIVHVSAIFMHFLCTFYAYFPIFVHCMHTFSTKTQSDASLGFLSTFIALIC